MHVVYISIIAFISFVLLSLILIMKKNARNRMIVNKITKCGKHVENLDELVDCIQKTLKQIYPYIVDIGIYSKDSSAYTRKSNTVIDFNDKNLLKSDINKKAPPKIPDRIYNLNVKKYGRYNLYHITDDTMAFVFLSKTKLNLAPYKETFQLILKEASLLKTTSIYKNQIELLNIKHKSSEFFMAFSSNKEFTVSFLGNIAKNVVKTPYIEVKWEDILYKDGEYTDNECRDFFVRGTNITLKICGKHLHTDKVRELGRMLDMVSLIIMKEPVIENYLNILINLVRSSEDKSQFYKNHSETVKQISITLGNYMNLKKEQIETLKYASLLHDIGSIEAISGFLIKKEKLTETEYSKMKYHPVIGASITHPINELYPISKPILQHHEFCDGSGYPYGISSEEILIESRILSCAEVYAGLISPRPYRKEYSYEDALEIIKVEFEGKISKDVILALDSAYIEISEILNK